MGRAQEKKQRKRQALLDAAYELFLDQGLEKTSIDSIVSRAKVAKGTFYLYFTDKDAILQALLWKISDNLFDEALAETSQLEGASFTEKLLCLADYMVEYLRRNTLVLRLLRHNLRWPRMDELEETGQPPQLLVKAFRVIRSCPELKGWDEGEIYQVMTALVSMCVSMCYSCVIEQRPDTLDNMKPVLYTIIKKSLQYSPGSPL